MVDLNYQNTINLDEGGYLTSEGYSATILKLVQSKSVCEPFLATYPMNHKVENINTIATNPSAYFVAQEAAVKQKSAFKFGTFKMELQEIATIIPFTEDWVKFANAQTAAMLQEAIVNAITKLVDQSYLGYVTNPWLNTISGVCTGAHVISTGADLLIKISNAIGQVEEADFIPDGVIAPLSEKAVLRNLRDLNGQPIFQPANAVEPATLYGLPIRFSSNMIASGSPAAKELIVGDFKQAYKGNDAAIEFKMLDQATINVGGTLINLAEQDMIAIRAKVWKAFNVLRPAAFAKVLL